MNPTKRAYLELHIAVLLFGLTAILGDLIQLSALSLVWWRVFITSLSLLFIVRIGKILKNLSPRMILTFMGIGCIVALHWIAFYGSIKLSNASIGVVCMATTSFFTSLIEPLIMRQPVKWFEVLLGLFIIPGMVLIVNGTDFSMFNGILVGLLAALLASIFAILNKKFIGRSDEMSITFLELGSAWIFISVLMPIWVAYSGEAVQLWPAPSDWVYLIILSLLCTTLAYVLALRSLRHLSAFASNLAINLEPVYGIILAWIILNEHEELSPTFYYGVLIIILTVFSYPILKRLFERPNLNPKTKAKIKSS